MAQIIYSNPNRGYTYAIREVSRRDGESEHASDYRVEILAQVKGNDALGYLIGQYYSLSGLIGPVSSLNEAVEAFYSIVCSGHYAPGLAPGLGISHTHTEDVLIRLYGADPRPCPPVASAKIEVTRTC